MSSTRDYKGDEVKPVDVLCEDCGKELNETELQESRKHIEGDRVFCTKHLNNHLEIPE